MVAPTGTVEPEEGPLVWVTAGVPQLSVAAGAVKLYRYPQVPALLSTVILAGQNVKVGATASVTVIRLVQALVLP